MLPRLRPARLSGYHWTTRSSGSRDAIAAQMMAASHHPKRHPSANPGRPEPAGLCRWRWRWRWGTIALVDITEGLNIVEAFNGANSVLEAALVYVNTLMLREVLADAWADILTAEDRRGLTLLFWQHVLPYGEVKLDMMATNPCPWRRERVEANGGDRNYGVGSPRRRTVTANGASSYQGLRSQVAKRCSNVKPASKACVSKSEME